MLRNLPKIFFSVFYLICGNGFLGAQTLWYVCTDLSSEESGSVAVDESAGETIRQLMRLDLPFLLNLPEFKEITLSGETAQAVGNELKKRIAEETAGEGESPDSEKNEPKTVGDESVPLPVDSLSEKKDEKTSPVSDQSQSDREVSESDESSAENEENQPEEDMDSQPVRMNETPVDPVFSLAGVTEASQRDAFVYVIINRFRTTAYDENRKYSEISFDFYLAYENRYSVFSSTIRASALGETEELSVGEAKRSLRIAFKSVLNTLFGTAGTPYIVDFINEKKVVIAHGREQGAFPGAFYRIVRHEMSESGDVTEKIIGRLYVEKCEKNYSFCRVLYASERPVPGDGIRKIPGIGIHQSVGYDLTISSIAVSETETQSYFNHLLGFRWAVNREMPIAKPVFGIEVLTGPQSQMDTVGMMTTPAVGNIFAGMQIDRFFHQFAFTTFLDLGIAFTANASADGKTLTWFTCKAGGRFLWLFHEQVGLYLEGGYISWLGIPASEPLFEDSQYVYYSPNDYTGGFGGIGLTVLY